jgi:MFS family permease
MNKEKEGMGSFYKITFLIGLGFFTMGLMDPLYDSYVPMFLRNYLSRDSLVGALMAVDNVFAIMLIPIFSALSDKTRTPIGRRMPYIIVTLPLTAILFALLPGAALKSLGLLVLVIFLLNLFKQAARGPVVALMPDIIPGRFRSEANGVINTMGGIAAIVGTVALARLYDVNIKLPLLGSTIRPLSDAAEGSVGYIGFLPFILTGILVALATLLLFLMVHEKKHPEDQDEKNSSILSSLKFIFRAQSDRSVLFILLSLLCWFIAYQGVLPWIGLYGIEFLNLSPGMAPFSSGMVGIAYAAFAIPAGILAHRIGRKKTIRICLCGLTVILVLLFFHHNFSQGLNLGAGIKIATFWTLLFCFGLFWGAVTTNSFPMLWQMADYNTMGIYTGLYYFFSQAAGVIAPVLTGFLRDAFGPRVVFINGAVFMILAFVFMSRVKRGEAEEGSPVEGESADSV